MPAKKQATPEPLTAAEQSELDEIMKQPFNRLKGDQRKRRKDLITKRNASDSPDGVFAALENHNTPEAIKAQDVAPTSVGERAAVSRQRYNTRAERLAGETVKATSKPRKPRGEANGLDPVQRSRKRASDTASTANPGRGGNHDSADGLTTLRGTLEHKPAATGKVKPGSKFTHRDSFDQGPAGNRSVCVVTDVADDSAGWTFLVVGNLRSKPADLVARERCPIGDLPVHEYI